MTLTINGMTVSGTVEEIREMIANPPCKPIAEQKEYTELAEMSPNKSEGGKILGSTCRYCSVKGECSYYRNGYCTMSVLCSNPPQYERCKQELDIPQYKFCSEVEKGNR